MYQSYDSKSDPARHPPRLAALRKVLAARDLDGFIVPRADAHQGDDGDHQPTPYPPPVTPTHVPSGTVRDTPLKTVPRTLTGTEPETPIAARTRARFSPAQPTQRQPCDQHNHH